MGWLGRQVWGLVRPSAEPRWECQQGRWPCGKGGEPSSLLVHTGHSGSPFPFNCIQYLEGLTGSR